MNNDAAPDTSRGRTHAARQNASSRSLDTKRSDDPIRDFFRRGDHGQYEGGPADRALESLPSVDIPERPRIVRTAIQEARRRTLIRVEALVLAGCLALLVTAARVKSRGATQLSYGSPPSRQASEKSVSPQPEPKDKPLVAQPVAAQPVAAQPVAAQPVAAQPVAAQPVAAQPVAAQPVAAHPVAAQPVAAQPVAAQPVAAQPVAAQPVAAQPVAAQPDTPTPAKPAVSPALEPLQAVPPRAPQAAGVASVSRVRKPTATASLVVPTAQQTTARRVSRAVAPALETELKPTPAPASLAPKRAIAAFPDD